MIAGYPCKKATGQLNCEEVTIYYTLKGFDIILSIESGLILLIQAKNVYIKA